MTTTGSCRSSCREVSSRRRPRLLLRISISKQEDITLYYGTIWLLTLDADFELDIVDVLLLLLLKVALYRSSILESLSAERLQGISSDDPRANGRAKVLAVKWTKRNILPGLNVTSTPVIQQNVTKNVLVRVVDVDRRAHLSRFADEAAKLKLIVKSLAQAGSGLLGCGSRVRQDLAAGTVDGCARDDNAGRATVVTDGKVGVVGLQRVVGATEEDTDLEGVVVSGVEIGVVANLHGQVHLDLVDGHKGLLLQGIVVLEHSAERGALVEDALKLTADSTVSGTAELSKGVEGGLGKGCGRGGDGLERLSSSGIIGEGLEVKNVVANTDTGASSIRACREDAKRQVVNREIAVGVGSNPGFRDGHCE